MPFYLPKGCKQQSTEVANLSRLVTKLQAVMQYRKSSVRRCWKNQGSQIKSKPSWKKISKDNVLDAADLPTPDSDTDEESDVNPEE
ncbi:hypothetical protein KP79_PYT13761 [Mizuhopecten yessoensis]|uniref:Uncharacterized protein n=1 Tax=Mizuhopecten yessoensis TaxID=6573 RepID=A0A210R6H0_MIZYE|nr:hypothetical protein KP79_PYT13761 [Mizuhopecten yessoensis]